VARIKGKFVKISFCEKQVLLSFEFDVLKMQNIFRGSAIFENLRQIPEKHSAVFSFATALIGSCLCPIQLVLNALGFGCAGFAVLTPYRVPFAMLTFANVSLSFWAGTKSPRQFALSLLSMSVLFSPEIVKLINRSSLKYTPTMGFETRLSIIGVKCEACANRVKNLLEEIEGVDSAAVLFGENKAFVHSKRPILNAEIKAKMEETDFELVIDERIQMVKQNEIAFDATKFKNYTLSVTDFSCDEELLAWNEYLSQNPSVIRVSNLLRDKTSTVTTCEAVPQDFFTNSPGGKVTKITTSQKDEL
jgi:copper chaperone CopZ